MFFNSKGISSESRTKVRLGLDSLGTRPLSASELLIESKAVHRFMETAISDRKMTAPATTDFQTAQSSFAGIHAYAHSLTGNPAGLNLEAVLYQFVQANPQQREKLAPSISAQDQATISNDIGMNAARAKRDLVEILDLIENSQITPEILHNIEMQGRNTHPQIVQQHLAELQHMSKNSQLSPEKKEQLHHEISFFRMVFAAQNLGLLNPKDSQLIGTQTTMLRWLYEEVQSYRENMQQHHQVINDLMEALTQNHTEVPKQQLVALTHFLSNPETPAENKKVLTTLISNYSLEELQETLESFKSEMNQSEKAWLKKNKLPQEEKAILQAQIQIFGMAITGKQAGMHQPFRGSQTFLDRVLVEIENISRSQKRYTENIQNYNHPMTINLEIGSTSNPHPTPFQFTFHLSRQNEIQKQVTDCEAAFDQFWSTQVAPFVQFNQAVYQNFIMNPANAEAIRQSLLATSILQILLNSGRNPALSQIAFEKIFKTAIFGLWRDYSSQSEGTRTRSHSLAIAELIEALMFNVLQNEETEIQPADSWGALLFLALTHYLQDEKNQDFFGNEIIKKNVRETLGQDGLQALEDLIQNLFIKNEDLLYRIIDVLKVEGLPKTEALQLLEMISKYLGHDPGTQKLLHDIEELINENEG